MIANANSNVTDAVFANPDWTSLGMVTSIVGAFLIANATLLEHPRRLVARYFGTRQGRLMSVREYVYNRVQTTLGFTFLLLGFGMQLYGHVLSRPADEGPLKMGWVGLVVILAVLLLFSAWWWSLWAFRRYVREYYLEHPIPLESDGAIAREIGELFGVESREDDTVEEFVLRLRQKAGLPARVDRGRDVFTDAGLDEGQGLDDTDVDLSADLDSESLQNRA